MDQNKTMYTHELLTVDIDQILMLFYEAQRRVLKNELSTNDAILKK